MARRPGRLSAQDGALRLGRRVGAIVRGATGPPAADTRRRMSAPSGRPVVASVPSPCTGVCRVDETTGWCAGCLRRLDEIAEWSRADDATRRGILRRIVLRRGEAPSV